MRRINLNMHCLLCQSIDMLMIFRYKPSMKKIILTLAAALLVFSSGCNFPLLAAAPVTPTVTATLQPTASPTPQPTATATPTPEPEVRIEQADSLLAAGELEQAQAGYQQALDQTPDNLTQAAALLGLGRIDYQNGDCATAVSQFNQVVTLAPDTGTAATAYYLLGQCYAQQDNYLLAAQAYQAYLGIKPGVLDDYIYELMGDAEFAAQSYLAASKSYRSALDAADLTDPSWLRIKIARSLAGQEDYQGAIQEYVDILATSGDDYAKAQVDFLLGQTYLIISETEQAYARFQDSVASYPRSLDSYQALVALVDAGQTVSDLDRGLVDYFAGQYGVAVDAFERYLANAPDHDGTAHHYKALSLRALGQYENAIAEWNMLIDDHTQDRFFAAAWEEKADTYYSPYSSANLNQLQQSLDTLTGYVSLYPDSQDLPAFLFLAARYLEFNNRLPEAAVLWERMINEYPSAENSYRALFLAAVTRYRLEEYQQALNLFERAAVLASNNSDGAAANLWVGKTKQTLGDAAAAQTSWQRASKLDPYGYYSIRAIELLQNQQPLKSGEDLNLGYDLVVERNLAALWMRERFGLSGDADLSGTTLLSGNRHFERANAFYELGLISDARAEFEVLRQDIAGSPAALFQLVHVLLSKDYNRSAILCARQVLNLAGFTDATALQAPPYFNHVRYGAYFLASVVDAAAQEEISPLLLFSLMRQESLFDASVTSSAGARGLTQIMPATGVEIVSLLGWPPDYKESDLFRPAINIRLGARYLARQRDYLDGSLTAALAGYNGGPGNARVWKDIAGDDPDLFLEVVRAAETRLYIQHIVENMAVYRELYEGLP